jgi:DNA-binding LacI/PurR family transcriptional regulator
VQKNIIQRRFPTVIIPIQNLIEGVVNIKQGSQVGVVGAEYLLNQGFKHFAFCGGKDRWSVVRQEHFKCRIKQAGFDVTTYPPEDNFLHLIIAGSIAFSPISDVITIQPQPNSQFPFRNS